jgi:tight adherence protein B
VFIHWWLAAVLVPVGLCLPFLRVAARRRLRQRKLGRQLPEAFQMISRAVKAGQTVPAALNIIAQDFEPPISEEFALCYEQQNLGLSRESALRKLARRSGIMELQIFVVALLVQAKSGGDLAELLDNLAAMIRKRLKLKDRIRALTGEGRMQALVLIVLPIVAFFGVIFLAPDYGKCLLDRPWLLAGTAAAQLIGAAWIRQIISFEY